MKDKDQTRKIDNKEHKITKKTISTLYEDTKV